MTRTSATRTRPSADHEVVNQVVRRGGAARFSELTASRYTLARLVDQGHLLQPARGCYSVPKAPRSVVSAAVMNGAVGCVTALRHHGLEVGGDADVLHLVVPPNRGSAGPRPPRVRRHRGDVSACGEARVHDPVHAAASAMTCLDYVEAVVLLDQIGRAWGRGVVDQTLARVAAAHRALADALRTDTDRRARSAIESRARLALRRAGFAVAAGVDLPGVGEVDLLVDGWLVVELDGFAFHSTRKQFRDDRRRDRAIARLGLTVLRFAWEDCHPSEIVRSVSELVGTRGDGVLPAVPVLERALGDLLAEIRAAAVGPSARAVGRPPAPRSAQGRAVRRR